MKKKSNLAKIMSILYKILYQFIRIISYCNIVTLKQEYIEVSSNENN